MTSHGISDGVKAMQTAPSAQLEHLGQEKQLRLRALGRVEGMDEGEGACGHSAWVGGSRTELSVGSVQPSAILIPRKLNLYKNFKCRYKLPQNNLLSLAGAVAEEQAMPSSNTNCTGRGLEECVSSQ